MSTDTGSSMSWTGGSNTFMSASSSESTAETSGAWEDGSSTTLNTISSTTSAGVYAQSPSFSTTNTVPTPLVAPTSSSEIAPSATSPSSTGTVPLGSLQTSPPPQPANAALAAQEAAHRRRVLIIGVVAALFVLLAAVGAWWTWRRRRNAKATGGTKKRGGKGSRSERTVHEKGHYVQSVDVVSLVDSSDIQSLASANTIAQSSRRQPSERSSRAQDSVWADDSEADAMATDGSTIVRTVSQSSISRSSAYSQQTENPFDHPAYTVQSGTTSSRFRSPNSVTGTAAPWMSAFVGQMSQAWSGNGSYGVDSRPRQLDPAYTSENPFEQDPAARSTPTSSSGSGGTFPTTSTSVTSPSRLNTSVSEFRDSDKTSSASTTSGSNYPSPLRSPRADEYPESPFADSPFEDPIQYSRTHRPTVVQHRDAGPAAHEIHLPPAYGEIYGAARS